MHKRPRFIPYFHCYRQGVPFPARSFFVVLHLARLSGPPPGAASAVSSSCRGGVCRISRFLMQGPGGGKKDKFSRLGKAFLLRVAERNRNFYTFLSQARMKCPL